MSESKFTQKIKHEMLRIIKADLKVCENNKRITLKMFSAYLNTEDSFLFFLTF